MAIRFFSKRRRLADVVDDGMGHAFTLDKLVNTTGSNLCFRLLEPKLGMHLIRKKSRIFSKVAEVFLDHL
ncbi:hypothetical protein H6B51_15535 [Pseudoflavonifractor phocaeensis]|nr:hypothetical protein [Pseudoflavonifractor phocaeensis]